MQLLRRRTKMKLKIGAVVALSTIILATLWYYVYTGKDPIAGIKHDFHSVVEMHYNRTRSNQEQRDLENSTAHLTVSDSTLLTFPQRVLVPKENSGKIGNNSEVNGRYSSYQNKEISSSSETPLQQHSEIFWRLKPSGDENDRASDQRDDLFVMPAQENQTKDPESSNTTVQQHTIKELQETPQRQDNKSDTDQDFNVISKNLISSSQPIISKLNALRSSNTIIYKEGYLEFVRSTFFREARPRNSSTEKLTVLLLHGTGLTSTIWINIGTFQTLVESGYRTLAIDLPGYGRSMGSEIPYTRDAILGYMTNLFTAFQFEHPVVVTPSRSGEYAMPLIMAYPHLIRGVVAIAPTYTSKFLLSAYEKLSIPMLVLFGEKDQTMLHQTSLDSLQLVPHRKIYMIRNSSHACYIDHPPTFHKLLLQFLERVYT